MDEGGQIKYQELQGLLRPVSSSNLDWVAYVNRLGVCVVVFHSGAMWAYQIPEELYVELLKSPSKGKFFVSQIRDKYPSFSMVYQRDNTSWKLVGNAKELAQ